MGCVNILSKVWIGRVEGGKDGRLYRLSASKFQDYRVVRQAKSPRSYSQCLVWFNDEIRQLTEKQCSVIFSDVYFSIFPSDRCSPRTYLTRLLLLLPAFLGARYQKNFSPAVDSSPHDI